MKQNLIKAEKDLAIMSTITVVKHPLLANKLSILRDKDTPSPVFRRVLREVAWLLAFDATRHLKTETISITTPLEDMQAEQLVSPKPCLVSILRAGNGMVEALLNILPEASVGHLGMARNHETLLPEEYYVNLPDDIAQRQVILADPMLATAGSTIAALDKLKQAGVADIVFVCLVAAPEGVEALAAAHPDVPAYTAALDRELNDKGYILPGLGDAGDRIYGT